MKRKSLIVAAISGILSLFIFGGVARAQAVRSAENVTVPKNQVINSMLYSTGTDIKIEGTINGDLFCFGQNITISGIVLPRSPGVQVVLKKFIAGTWKNMGAPTLTQPDGTFTFNLDKPADNAARGVQAYQIVVSGDQTFAVVTSEPFSVIVR